MKIDKHPSPVVSLIKLTTLLLFITSCFYAQNLFASLLHNQRITDYSVVNQLHIEEQNSNAPLWPILNIESVGLTENQTESDTDDLTDFEHIECLEITQTVINDDASVRTKAHHISSLKQNRPVLYLYVLFHSWKSFIC